MAARGRRRRALGAWRAFAVSQREGRLRTLRACAVSFPSAQPEPPATAAAPAGERAPAGQRRAAPRSPAPPPLDVPALVARALAERGAGAAPDLGGLTLSPKPAGGGGGAPLFWKLLLLAASGGAEGATARWLRARLAGGGGCAAWPLAAHRALRPLVMQHVPIRSEPLLLHAPSSAWTRRALSMPAGRRAGQPRRACC
jgi:hypothetical protein